MNLRRALLTCLVAAFTGWSATSASAQIGNNPLVPADNQLKFESLSGPYDNPVIFRVLMNDYMFDRFRRTGLAHVNVTGPTQPALWLAQDGKYYPMQYIGRRGMLHELRLVHPVMNPVARPATPAAAPAPTVAPNTPGCCAWRHPNGTPTCSGHPAAACQGELRGTFYPGYSCKITSECSP